MCRVVCVTSQVGDILLRERAVITFFILCEKGNWRTTSLLTRISIHPNLEILSFRITQFDSNVDNFYFVFYTLRHCVVVLVASSLFRWST